MSTKKSDVQFKEISERLVEQAEAIRRGESDILAKLRMEKISNHIDKGNVLDVGCHHALLCDYLKIKDIKYYGIDISKQRVKASLQRAPNAVIVQQDVMNGIPFPNKMFDYVVLGEILEHVENTVYLLRECRRVLKTKGKLIITTPNARSFLSIMASLFNYHQYSLVVHLHTFSRYELENILKITGFEVKKMETLYFRLIPKKRINFEPMLKLFPQLGENLFCVAKPIVTRVKDIVDMIR